MNEAQRAPEEDKAERPTALLTLAALVALGAFLALLLYALNLEEPGGVTQETPGAKEQRTQSTQQRAELSRV